MYPLKGRHTISCVTGITRPQVLQPGEPRRDLTATAKIGRRNYCLYRRPNAYLSRRGTKGVCEYVISDVPFVTTWGRLLPAACWVPSRTTAWHTYSGNSHGLLGEICCQPLKSHPTFSMFCSNGDNTGPYRQNTCHTSRYKWF